MAAGTDKSLTILLDELKGFIENERQLFGDTLLFDAVPVESNAVAKQKLVQAEVPSVPSPSKHYIELETPKPMVAEEVSLFGDAVSPKPGISTEGWAASESLEALDKLICTCVKCPLGFTRTKFVFGVGNPKATLMIIGEAPGADEDAQGEPFVGRAGQLLNKILEAINFKRSDVYICNILKCRPPNNRKPVPEESEACKPYLKKQIDLIKPKIILCLGLTAAENLLGTKESMGKLRGQVMQYEGVPVMITYHPAALLRNPNWKRPAWEDVQAVRKLHDELVHN
ncbi:MAG: uracil-DNA glycosylase [bacterium]